MKTMGAAKAKTQFLALLDEVELKREPILVTKNGRPVAQLMPLPADDDPLAMYRFGSAKIVGDILSPAEDPNAWELD
jgi:prevent-host-death family protein